MGDLEGPRLSDQPDKGEALFPALLSTQTRASSRDLERRPKYFAIESYPPEFRLFIGRVSRKGEWTKVLVQKLGDLTRDEVRVTKCEAPARLN